MACRAAAEMRMAVKMVMTDDGRDGVGGLQRWPRGRGGDQRVCLGGDVGAGVRTPERVKLGGPDQNRSARNLFPQELRKMFKTISVIF